MKYSLAPMEGITYPEYRVLVNEMFPGAVCCYAPFVAPGAGGFTETFLKRRLPDTDRGYSLVPQLMANRADMFLETGRMLSDMGFREINLNAGCPSATVFSKHKGAGMLADTASLAEFLDEVFTKADFAVSIKTRMGVKSTEEFLKIAEIYNRYPVKELIIHARHREGYYKSAPDVCGYADAVKELKMPVCYNGNIFSAGELNTLLSLSPETCSIMLGRGMIANPALARMLNGGEALKKDEFILFHDRLIESYISAGLDSCLAVRRIKELWYYMICLFPDSARQYKAMMKAKSLDEYTVAFHALLSSCSFDGSAAFLNIQ